MLVAILILIGAAAWAQASDTFETGQWLHDLWITYQKIGNGTFGSTSGSKEWAAVMGVASVTQYIGFVTGTARVMWDADWIDLKGITREQQYAVLGKYLDDHPGQRNLPAEVLVYRALYAAWPGKVAAPYK